MYSTFWGPWSYASVANSGSGNRSEKEDGTDQMKEAIVEGIDLKKKAA